MSYIVPIQNLRHHAAFDHWYTILVSYPATMATQPGNPSSGWHNNYSQRLLPLLGKKRQVMDIRRPLLDNRSYRWTRKQMKN